MSSDCWKHEEKWAQLQDINVRQFFLINHMTMTRGTRGSVKESEACHFGECIYQDCDVVFEKIQVFYQSRVMILQMA